MKQMNFSMTKDGAIVFLEGEVYNVPRTHRYFNDIVDILFDYPTKENIEAVKELMDISSAVESFADGRITIEDGDMYYKGQPIEATALVDRILTLKDEGKNFSHFVTFLDNLMENPSEDSRIDLYRFLSRNNLPLTGDGHFLAYKKVRDDYTDLHSGYYDNSIGSVVEMNRVDVDPDRNNTCSTGLHAASMDYMHTYGGAINSQKVVIVKINPRDVVSVPVDHGDAKLRTCRYEVIAEMEEPEHHSLRSNFVESDNSSIFVGDVEEEDDYNPFEEDYNEEENDWDGSFYPYGLEEDDYEQTDEEVEAKNWVSWSSNGITKEGIYLITVEAGDSLEEAVDDYKRVFDNTKTAFEKVNKAKDVSSKDRYLVLVKKIDEVELPTPTLYAPVYYQVVMEGE